MFSGRFNVSPPLARGRRCPESGWITDGYFSLPALGRQENQAETATSSARGGKELALSREQGKERGGWSLAFPVRFLGETVSICSSGPNLTVNSFHYFLLHSTVCKYEYAPGIQPVFLLTGYRIVSHLHIVCVQHLAITTFTYALNIRNLAVWGFFLFLKHIQFFWQYIVTFTWSSIPSCPLACKVRGSIPLFLPWISAHVPG